MFLRKKSWLEEELSKNEKTWSLIEAKGWICIIIGELGDLIWFVGELIGWLHKFCRPNFAFEEFGDQDGWNQNLGTKLNFQELEWLMLKISKIERLYEMKSKVQGQCGHTWKNDLNWQKLNWGTKTLRTKNTHTHTASSFMRGTCYLI